MPKISVVINTLNEEKNIERAIKSVSWAGEVIVCDMHSEDKTVEIARKLGAKVIFHKKEGFVEPARNFAISKASNEWILVLDADEEIPTTLSTRLMELVNKNIVSDYVEVPRKNIIFGKWMKASMWWPDYNIRFFKKDAVEWSDKIHIPPKVSGQGLKIEAVENLSIIHHNYDNVGQFIDRLNRYTNIQAKELIEEGYKFNWQDLIKKPLGEFLNRYFANRGFEDGVHGLALGFLQAFSFLIMYLKVWEREKFKDQEIKLEDTKFLVNQGGKELEYWFKYSNLSKNPFKRFIQKAKNKII